MTAVSPIVILLVEDDPGDVMLVREAFEHNKVRNELRVASDGVEALEQLQDPSLSLPDLILLDLNLPRRTAARCCPRSDPRLTAIPVVVLTTSDAEADIIESYQLHANAYVTKPVDLNQFLEVVREIDNFFVAVVKLPNLSAESR